MTSTSGRSWRSKSVRMINVQPRATSRFHSWPDRGDSSRCRSATGRCRPQGQVLQPALGRPRRRSPRREDRPHTARTATPRPAVPAQVAPDVLGSGETQVDGAFEHARGHVDRNDTGDIDQGPLRPGDSDPLVNPNVDRLEDAAAMDSGTDKARLRRAGRGDLRSLGSCTPQSPHPRRTAVRHRRSGACSEARGRDPLLERRRRPRHRIDARLHSEQQAGSQPSLDLIGAQPKAKELFTGYQTAALGRHSLDRGIEEHGPKVNQQGVTRTPLLSRRGRQAPLTRQRPMARALRFRSLSRSGRHAPPTRQRPLARDRLGPPLRQRAGHLGAAPSGGRAGSVTYAACVRGRSSTW